MVVLVARRVEAHKSIGAAVVIPVVGGSKTQCALPATTTYGAGAYSAGICGVAAVGVVVVLQPGVSMALVQCAAGSSASEVNAACSTGWHGRYEV